MMLAGQQHGGEFRTTSRFLSLTLRPGTKPPTVVTEEMHPRRSERQGVTSLGLGTRSHGGEAPKVHVTAVDGLMGRDGRPSELQRGGGGAH